MRFHEHASSILMFPSGTRHCLICNEGFIGGDEDNDESQDDPTSKFPLTGEDVQVLDKLFQLELEEEEKEGLVRRFGVGPSSSLTSSTSFMTSATSSYCVSCSFKVGMLFQLWTDFDGIHNKINQIRTEFLQNIERTLPEVPPSCSAHTIKVKVLEKTSGPQATIVDPTLSETITCSTITQEQTMDDCGNGSGEGTILSPNDWIPNTEDLIEIHQISLPNNIESLNQADPQDEPVLQLNSLSPRVDVKDEVLTQSQLFSILPVIQSEAEHEPPSSLRNNQILGDIVDDSDEEQVESSLEEHDLSQQSVRGSTSGKVTAFERYEEAATYTEDDKNASSLLTCPEVELCGSEAFKSLRSLRCHFANEHLASKRGEVFYKGHKVLLLTFKCQVCTIPPKYFSNSSHLVRHMRNVHGFTSSAKSRICPEVEKCGSKEFGSVELLYSHFAKEHVMPEKTEASDKARVQIRNLKRRSLHTCPEVEKCGSEGFKTFELLRQHFWKDHLTSEKNEIVYNGQVQTLVFECKLCSPLKRFTRQDHLSRHMKEVHNVRIAGTSLLLCPEVEQCGSKGYQTLDLLRRHFVKEHFESEKCEILYNGQMQSLIFKCHVCPGSKVFTKRSALNIHMNVLHQATINTNGHEPPSPLRDSPILGDINNDDSDEGQVESSLEQQGLPQETVHESTCGTESGFEGHEKAETNTEKNGSSIRLSCPEAEAKQCGSEGFGSLRLLLRHFAKEHPASEKNAVFYGGQVHTLTYKCQVCLVPPKSFSRQTHFSRHMRNVHKLTGTGRSPLICPEVGQCGSNGFKSLKLLRSHFNKEHFSSETAKVLNKAQVQTKNVHELKVTGRTRFTCPEVEKCVSEGFNTLTSLRHHFWKYHLASEKNEIFYKDKIQILVFKCKLCSPLKGFVKQRYLETHIKEVHNVRISGSSLLPCPEVEQCGSEGYQTLELLRRHFCKEHFASEKSEILYKDQVQPLIFKCPLCSVSKGFTRHSDLNKHMNRVHKATMNTGLPSLSLSSSMDEDDESALAPANSRSDSDSDHSQSSDDSDYEPDPYRSNELDHNLSHPSTNTQQPSERRLGLRLKSTVNDYTFLDPKENDTREDEDNIKNLSVETSQRTPTPVRRMIVTNAFPESDDYDQAEEEEEDIKIYIDNTIYDPPTDDTFSNSTVGVPNEEIIPRVTTLGEETGKVRSKVTITMDGGSDPHPSPSPPGKDQRPHTNRTMTPPPLKKKRGRPRKYNPTPRPVKIAKFSNVSSESEKGYRQHVVLSRPRGRPRGTGKSKSLVSLKSNQRSIAQLKRNLDPMNMVTHDGARPHPMEDDNIADTEKFQFMIPIIRLHRLQLP